MARDPKASQISHELLNLRHHPQGHVQGFKQRNASSSLASRASSGAPSRALRP